MTTELPEGHGVYVFREVVERPPDIIGEVNVRNSYQTVRNLNKEGAFATTLSGQTVRTLKENTVNTYSTVRGKILDVDLRKQTVRVLVESVEETDGLEFDVTFNVEFGEGG